MNKLNKVHPLIIVFLSCFTIMMVAFAILTVVRHFNDDNSKEASGKPYVEATLEDSPFSEPVEFVTQLSDGQYLKCIRFDEDTTPVCDWNGAGYPYFIKGEAYGPNGKMTRGEVEQWNTQHTNQLPYPDDGADEADNNSTTKTTEPSYPTDANGPSSPTTQSNSRDSEDNEEDDFL